MKKIILFFSMLILLVTSCSYQTTNSERKEATSHTKAKQQEVLQNLPFEETTAFENAKKGFIANSKDNISFEFIKEQSHPDTVNPSLWRQAQLNNISGLFEVVPGIYQIRGFDLANITFIKGNTGWIIVDPLTTIEAAQKAMVLFREHQGNAPITGIIFTHSHADHFGGVKGLAGEKELSQIEVVAPENFFEESISENVLAGNVMSRRTSYMYGSLLPKDEKGTVDAGLGKGIALGVPSILKPTKTISKDYQRYVLDGVEFEFLMAQNTEAPAEFMFYLPKYKAASSAEVINHTLHNLSTLRGAKTRNALLWTDAIEKSREFLANRTDVLFGSHHWPTWGQDNIDQFLVKHGDLYRYIHDQTLRLANMGYTVLEIPERITLPKSLAQEFYNRGYYGSLNHDAKAVYDFYFGAWWDGNPAHLHKHEPEEAAKRYVQYMGGEKKIIRMAQKSYHQGDYRWVVEVLNHVIFANPNNQQARNLSADAMEQLGYQAESAAWRSYYLTGALELRQGVKEMPTPSTLSPDIINLMPVEDFLNYLAVKLNPEKADGKVINLNLNVDNESYGMTIENSVLKHSRASRKNADLTVSMSRAAFNQIIAGQADFEKALANKEIVVNDKQKFLTFLDLFDRFEFWFNIVLP